MTLKLLSGLFVLTLAAIACKGDSRDYLRNPNFRDLYYRNQFYAGLAIPNPNPKPVSTPDPATELLARKLVEITDNKDEKKDDVEDELTPDEKAISEDIYNFSPEGALRQYNPNDLRPLLISLQTELRRILKTQNEFKGLLKSILAINNETLSWEMNQATRFYSLISSLVPAY